MVLDFAAARRETSVLTLQSVCLYVYVMHWCVCMIELDGWQTCSVSGDTLQYRLEESVSHRRTRQVTQLFTYLLTHKLSSSCIWQCLVSRACDWVMPALCAVLHIFSFQFSLLFCFSSIYRLAMAAPALQRTIGFSTQYRTSDVAEYLGRYLSSAKRNSPGEKLWIDSNCENGN